MRRFGIINILVQLSFSWVLFYGVLASVFSYFFCVGQPWWPTVLLSPNTIKKPPTVLIYDASLETVHKIRKSFFQLLLDNHLIYHLSL